MDKLLIYLFSFLLLSCATSKTDKINNEEIRVKYAAKIDTLDLKEHVYLLASDILEGRKTGERGQKMAVNYITAYYQHIGLSAPEKYPEYFQTVPKVFFNKTSESDSENIVALIEGSEKPEEVIIISAHYDHLGKVKDQVYNGADDNASGTSALMEIAQAFQAAKKQGYGPKRSILFLHLTGEESGLYGSKYYIRQPLFPLDMTVANLNIDMIGRVDRPHRNKRNYIYLIGTKRLSTELHKLSESVNRKFSQLKLDYSFNDERDPNRFYYRSDHYNFAKNNIPVIFYFNGEHEDYHQPTDTADKIEFDLLVSRTRLIFYTAWELANRDNRLSLDEKTKE